MFWKSACRLFKPRKQTYPSLKVGKQTLECAELKNFMHSWGVKKQISSDQPVSTRGTVNFCSPLLFFCSAKTASVIHAQILVLENGGFKDSFPSFFRGMAGGSTWQDDYLYGCETKNSGVFPPNHPF